MDGVGRACLPTRADTAWSQLKYANMDARTVWRGRGARVRAAHSVAQIATNGEVAMPRCECDGQKRGGYANAMSL